VVVVLLTIRDASDRFGDIALSTLPLALIFDGPLGLVFDAVLDTLISEALGEIIGMLPDTTVTFDTLLGV